LHQQQGEMHELSTSGPFGLQVSELSIGSWVTYGNQVDTRGARIAGGRARRGGQLLRQRRGVCRRQSEEIMGQALKELAWPRVSYVVSTKFFWGLDEAPNQYHTLNRKYLLNAIDASLKRLQLDYVDLVFCHRPDPNTPGRGNRLGHERHDHARQGALLGHVRMERRRNPRGVRHRGTAPSAQAGHGTAAVQPVPPQSRRTGIQAALRGHRSGPDHLEPARVRACLPASIATACRPTAARSCKATTGCASRSPTPARTTWSASSAKWPTSWTARSVNLAIAWILKNPQVSTVITGASRIEQIAENMQSAEVATRITPEIKQKIEEIIGDAHD
jgi:hypothetical protein